jgi:hypothetical protein
LEKDFEHLRVEATVIFGHDPQGLLRGIGGPIPPIAGERVIGISNPNDPGFQWDLIAFETVRVTAAVKILEDNSFTWFECPLPCGSRKPITLVRNASKSTILFQSVIL